MKERFSLKLTLNTLSIVGFGLGSLFVPQLFWASFGIDLSPTGEVVVRMAGGVVTGNVILSWLVRNAPDSPLRQAVVLDFFVAWGLVFVVALLGQLAGVTNALGWFTVGLALVWTLVMGRLRFGAQAARHSDAA